jgi:hypothetical protein
MTDLKAIRQAIKDKPTEETMKVKITEAALKKAQAYAAMIEECVGDRIECYGFLTCPIASKDGIATDIYFPEQSANSIYCRVKPETIIKIGRDLRNKGVRITGWWHSHGKGAVGHSSTDDNNIKVVLNEIASENCIEVPHKTKLIKGDMISSIKGNKLVIEDRKNNVSVELDYKGKINADILDSFISSPIKVGFAYSIVVNAKGDKPYCEIATKEFCPMYFRETEDTSIKTELEMIPGGDAAIGKIKEEITAKVTKRTRHMMIEEEEEDKVFTKEEVIEMMEKEKEKIMTEQETRFRKLCKEHPMLNLLLKWWDFIVYGENNAEEKRRL